MYIAIKVLDVQDGDAIMVRLSRDGEDLIFLIDGGRDRNAAMIIGELNVWLKACNKTAPDFILCTHYDDDHIGGLFKIISTYAAGKPKIWMHKTLEKADLEEFKQQFIPSSSANGVFPCEQNDYLNGSIESRHFQDFITNAEQELSLTALIKSLGLDCTEPLVENFHIENWPEIRLLSPSADFYSKQFPGKFSEIVRAETAYIVAEAGPEEQTIPEGLTCFESLDQTLKAKITPTNMNSAVLLLATEGKKFLFTADAGIEALNNIDPKQIADLFWLKVPHHGSINNLNSDLIRLMNPRHAFISGKKHVSPVIEACFKALNCDVQITRDQQTLFFEKE